MDTETKTYQITGTPEQLRVLEKMFIHMEYLGTIGASRNILLRVDGDGAARMRFKDGDGLYLSDYIKDWKLPINDNVFPDLFRLQAKYTERMYHLETAEEFNFEERD